jgi:hypothetical protein
VKIPSIPFRTIDWQTVPAEEHSGATGLAIWRTVHLGEVRVRTVEYTPGYRSDHWCEKGHVLLCLEGRLHTDLSDGRHVILDAGMTYLVGDDGTAHRSAAPQGARLFIVD